MEDAILLAHGSGGKLSHDLIDRVFRPAFRNEVLDQGDDAAVVDVPARGRLAMTTDTYVVKPLFFPGGDIGRLAVCGTVNDLSMVGATPYFLTAAFVLEEGLSMDTMRRVALAMAATAQEAGVRIVTGDTKVVQRGEADGLFINTAGLGVVPNDVSVSGSLARPGDVVIVSGTMGDHGIAVVSQREGLAFQTEVRSDVAPLNGLVAALLEAGRRSGLSGPVHVLRD
ncbi:MAG: hydrogenase expression/formation protein HypE, partial [Chloroflexota bacterium]|nr:hydrogenase expression/formation protein HypE [Chloroflexota bacterium]